MADGEGKVFCEFSNKVIEMLSAAAKYASGKSRQGLVVTIEVRFLALHIHVTEAGPTKVRQADHAIGWTELYHLRKTPRMMETIINHAIQKLN